MSLTVSSSTKDCIAENLILCHNKRLQANFFITYIMTTGWAGLPLEILQTGALIFNFLKRHTVEKSTPLLADVYSLPYYRTLPMVLLFTLFGLVYSIINPLLLPFLLVYFILGYIVFRNQVCTSFQIKVDGYDLVFCCCCLLPYTTDWIRDVEICAFANVSEEARINHRMFWNQSRVIMNYQSPLTVSHKKAT